MPSSLIFLDSFQILDHFFIFERLARLDITALKPSVFQTVILFQSFGMSKHWNGATR